MKIALGLCLLLLFVLSNGSLISAQSALEENSPILTSIQNLSLGNGAKAKLLTQYSGSIERLASSPAGSVFSYVDQGKYMNVSSTADFGGCGAPNHRFYLEVGFAKHTDSDGGAADAVYVYMNYSDFDCAGNPIGAAQGYVDNDNLPDGTVITVTPFKDGSVLVDVDIVEHDMDWVPNGITRHLTVNFSSFTGNGFTALDKNKTVAKRVDYNETTNWLIRYRPAIAVGQLIYDGHSYDLSGPAENIVTWKFNSKFEDLL